MKEYIIIFKEPWFQWQEDYRDYLINKEYNTDTSIPHFIESEDIVRTACITNEDADITE